MFEFGPDGGVYVSDWVQGWNKTGKGRIFASTIPRSIKVSRYLETKRLLAEGMERRPPKELARLLANRDMRVRQEAQFALADKGRVQAAPVRLSALSCHLCQRFIASGLCQRAQTGLS